MTQMEPKESGAEVSTTISGQKYPTDSTGPVPYSCPNISVVNPHPLLIHVSQLQFSSVGRIGPSPAESSDTDDATEAGL